MFQLVLLYFSILAIIISLIIYTQDPKFPIHITQYSNVIVISSLIINNNVLIKMSSQSKQIYYKFKVNILIIHLSNEINIRHAVELIIVHFISVRNNKITT